MTKSEFKAAITLAMNPGFEPMSYLGPEMEVFHGCAVDQKRRFVTLGHVASLIVGHCATFAGTWDMKELPELQELSKRFDLVGMT